MVTKGDLTAFHSNKELEIVFEQAKLEIENVNQLDQWSTPPMTSKELMWDPTRLIFHSNETLVPNSEAQDL